MAIHQDPAIVTTPLVLPNGTTLPNRIAKAAMTEGLADAYGAPTPALDRLYQRWSGGGAGLLITGNIQVDGFHLERAGNVIVDEAVDDALDARLRSWAEAGKSSGSKIWGQMSHAGRQTPHNINPAPKAPSAIGMNVFGMLKFGPPVALLEPEIEQIIRAFAKAARRLSDAGFDGVQVHAAHGYLLSTFLSPAANQRTDLWGGSLENRARLLLEIVRAIRAATPDHFAIGVKLNSADFQRGGFDLDDSAKVAEWLDAEGIDLLELSGGTYETLRMATPADQRGAQRSTAAREGYFLEFTPRIRSRLKRARLMVTGGFRSAQGINDALLHDGIDVIGIGRPLCVEPDLPSQIMSGAITAMPRYEDQLRLGPGLFSARSTIKFLKEMNVFSAQSWYCEQIFRLGHDLPMLSTKQMLRAAGDYKRRDAEKAAQLQQARRRSAINA